jgi:hypothetical protein
LKVNIVIEVLEVVEVFNSCQPLLTKNNVIPTRRIKLTNGTKIAYDSYVGIKRA